MMGCPPMVAWLLMMALARLAVASRFTKALVMSPNIFIATGKAEPWRKAARVPRTMKMVSRQVAV